MSTEYIEEAAAKAASSREAAERDLINADVYWGDLTAEYRAAVLMDSACTRALIYVGDQLERIARLLEQGVATPATPRPAGGPKPGLHDGSHPDCLVCEAFRTAQTREE